MKRSLLNHVVLLLFWSAGAGIFTLAYIYSWVLVLDP